MITTLREILSTEPKKKILIYILGYFGFVFIPFFLLLIPQKWLSTEGLWETCEFSFLMARFHGALPGLFRIEEGEDGMKIRCTSTISFQIKN